MNEITAKLKGRFKFVVRNGETLEVTNETPWMDNLILDSGLNHMGTGDSVSHCQVGTSNAAPNASQTALASFLASTALTSSAPGTAPVGSPYRNYRTYYYRFAIGAAAGNLSEVGVGWTLPAGNLFARALTVDGGGVPTTITVLPTEVLDVYYELGAYPVLTDTAFSITISGVSHSCVMRTANVTTQLSNQFGRDWLSPSYFHAVAYTSGLAAITSAPTGFLGSVNATTVNAYVNNSLQIDVPLVFGLSQANGSIQSMTFNSTIGEVQISFSPPIAKVNTKSLTMTFRWKWAKH